MNQVEREKKLIGFRGSHTRNSNRRSVSCGCPTDWLYLRTPTSLVVAERQTAEIRDKSRVKCALGQIIAATYMYLQACSAAVARVVERWESEWEPLWILSSNFHTSYCTRPAVQRKSEVSTAKGLPVRSSPSREFFFPRATTRNIRSEFHCGGRAFDRARVRAFRILYCQIANRAPIFVC